jgi:hypothetical protein
MLHGAQWSRKIVVLEPRHEYSEHRLKFVEQIKIAEMKPGRTAFPVIRSTPVRKDTKKQNYACKPQSPRVERRAHHWGCRAIALTPLCTILYLKSCRRGNADETFRGLPSGRIAPVQKTSAELAARGQAIESRFSGEDCSVQRSCWPINRESKLAYIRTSMKSRQTDPQVQDLPAYRASSPKDRKCRTVSALAGQLMTPHGQLNKHTFCQVLNGSHQLFLMHPKFIGDVDPGDLS